MALTRTSLSAACTAADTTLAITSTSSGFPAVNAYASPVQVMQVDNEKMLIVVVPVSGSVKVAQRGYDGTIAAAHDILAPVVTSSTAADFAALAWGAVDSRMPYLDDIVAVGQNGTIAVPTKNTTFLLTKASALGTTTLGAPAKDQDGLRLTFTSQTAAAHVITATTLLANGLSGTPWTTATFAAQIGAGMVLVADNAIWNVVSQPAVTLT